MLKKRIFDLYRDLQIGKNPVCIDCIEKNRLEGFEISEPISPWKIGKDFSTDFYKVVFVGKVARGNEQLGKIRNSLFRDATAKGDDLLINRSWAFWSYTREIIERVYGDLARGKEKICFTNIVKCNVSKDKDKTIDETKNYCINTLGVIWKEISLVGAKKVVFYTGIGYDKFIDNYKPTDTWIDKFPKKHKVKIGMKKMPFWNRVFYNEENEQVFVNNYK